MQDVILWTLRDCPVCDRVKHCLPEGGYTELDANALIDGTQKHPEAMVQLAMQDMQLPLVMVNGYFVDPHTFLKEHDSEAA